MSFIISFISMIIGIIIIGYFQFKSNNRLKDFNKAIRWCLFGFLFFILFYFVIVSLFFIALPHYISSVILPVFLPLIGAVIGLNFIFSKAKG